MLKSKINFFNKKKILNKLNIQNNYISNKYFKSLNKFENNTICFANEVDKKTLNKINKLQCGIIILPKKNSLIKKKYYKLLT